MFPPLHLYSFQIIAKLIIIFFQLFTINKNIQDTLSLCVSRNGTKKSGTTYRCTSLLSTGGSPMSFMSFVNFSQFNLGFYEFRNCLRLVWRFLKKICKRAYAIIFWHMPFFQFLFIFILMRQDWSSLLRSHPLTLQGTLLLERLW